MKRVKVLVFLLAVIMAVSISGGIASFAEGTESAPTSIVERVTAVNRYATWEEITIVFDEFSDTDRGTAGNYGGVINQVMAYIDINGISLAKTVSETSNIENNVLASWWTDVYGKRTLNISINSALPEEYRFKSDGGDTLLIRQGLMLPEGEEVSEDITFTYDATVRNWKTDADINGLEIVKTEVAAPAHIDYVFWFDYAPDTLIDNAFMSTLGGAFHDPNNNASPIYFAADNAYWGDNFDKITLNGQPLRNKIQDGVPFQLWWYGNGMTSRSLTIRLVVAGGVAAPYLNEGDTLQFLPGFHTPDGVVVKDVLSFTFVGNQFSATETKSVSVNKATDVIISPQAGYELQSFSVFLDAEAMTQLSIHNMGAAVTDKIVLNKKTATEWGSGPIGPHVQVNLRTAVGGCRLDVFFVVKDGTDFTGMSLDGTDVFILKSGLKIGSAFEVKEDLVFYNYGNSYSNRWYDEAEKGAAVAVEESISALNGQSDRETVFAVYDNYCLLTEAQKSLVKNVEDLMTYVNAFKDSDAVAEDKDLLEIGFTNGETAGAVQSDLFLVSEGPNGSTIVWTSDNEAVIGADGKVTPPRGIENAEVVLTAILSRGNATQQKIFHITVSAKPWKVTFLDESGAYFAEKLQNSEGKFESVDAPYKKGYDFVGWITADGSAFDFAQTAEEDVTLKPSYSRTEYTITYQLVGGENAQENPVSYNLDTETFLFAEASRAGYAFEGWYTDSGYLNRIEGVEKGSTGNLIVYAKWSLVRYSIEYVLGGEAVNNNPDEYTIESTLTLSAPERAGYTFDGWYADENFTGEAVTQIVAGTTGDKVLYAKWTQKTEQPGDSDNGGDEGEKTGCSSVIGNGVFAMSFVLTGAAAAVIVMRKKTV